MEDSIFKHLAFSGMWLNMSSKNNQLISGFAEGSTVLPVNRLSSLFSFQWCFMPHLQPRSNGSCTAPPPSCHPAAMSRLSVLTMEKSASTTIGKWSQRRLARKYPSSFLFQIWFSRHSGWHTPSFPQCNPLGVGHQTGLSLCWAWNAKLFTWLGWWEDSVLGVLSPFWGEKSLNPGIFDLWLGGREYRLLRVYHMLMWTLSTKEVIFKSEYMNKPWCLCPLLKNIQAQERSFIFKSFFALGDKHRYTGDGEDKSC